MSILDLKRRLFPKGMKRAARSQWRRWFDRVTERDLAAAIGRLGIPDGAWVCIHSQLSALGYLPGGPRIVIDALRARVPGCTVLMPTFPFSGTALAHLESDPLYDPRTTPSASGVLSEALRQYPGAVRSLHPTHPCVAVGPEAEALIEGSERAETPFGPDSAYGRYAQSPKAWQLLIHTNSTSIVHEFQEAADMPNLFLPEQYTARGLDWEGREQRYQIKVHTPLLPLFVATPEYVWFPDYALPFPPAKREHLIARMHDKEAARRIVERHEELKKAGVFREARAGAALLMAVEVAPWRERIVRDVRESIHQYPERYSVQAVTEAKARGELITT